MKKVVSLFVLSTLFLASALRVQAQESMQLIDLGLSVLWADRNLGASAPEQTGNYYAWGETTTKSVYSWETYRFCDKGSPYAMTKYCLTYDYGGVDSRKDLETKDDAAIQQYGSVRIPTMKEWMELRNKCEWELIESGDTIGFRVTGPSGRSIYLPAAGLMQVDEQQSLGEFGFYWSSNLYHTFNNEAVAFVFAYNDAVLSHATRELGIPIRPVQTPTLLLVE